MTTTTPNRNFTYPVGSDPDNIPLHFQLLATDLDNWQVSRDDVDATLFLAPGIVVPTMWSTAPAGWLMLNGALVLQSTYPALAAAVDPTWLSGANIRLPDMRNRVPAGAAGAQTGTLGAIGGSATHAMTVAEIAAHRHQMTHVHKMIHNHGDAAEPAPGHHHGIPGRVTSEANIVVKIGGTQTHQLGVVGVDGLTGPHVTYSAMTDKQVVVGVPDYPPPTFHGYSGVQVNAADNSIAQTADAGSTTPFSVMQPFVAFNFAVKT